LVNEALAVEAEAAKDADALGFLARAMVQATLPHRRVEGNEYERRNGAFHLSLMAPAKFGLPYGSVPRLLLAWLTTEAVRTRSRELELGDSLSAFMRGLGLSVTGGKRGYIRTVKGQMQRLFASTITCTYEDRDRSDELGFRITDQSTLWWHPKSPEQAALWRSTVTLSEKFYTEVINRPVPVDMRALRALRQSPLALDLYAWATYRTSYLNRQTTIPWAALAAQFGSDYGRLRDFKAALVAELRKVEIVYPDLRAAPGDDGLTLLPSRPHVPRLPGKTL
jgi:hypothetical protein